MPREKIIQLNRKFLEVPEKNDEGLDPESMRMVALALNKSVDREGLIENRYAVILGEAGTGKTVEFRMQVERLQDNAVTAFFIPIEELAANGFDSCFSSRETEQLERWRTQGSGGKRETGAPMAGKH